ncbi:MAG: hypothetical protein WD043_12490 [Gemmatimonadales bacterium]
MRTVVLLGALVALTGTSAAQRPDVNALRQRTERLRTLTAAAQRLESVARQREADVPKDTIPAGPLLVIVEQGRTAQIREGVTRAGETMRSLLGEDASLLEGRHLQLAFGIGTSSGVGQVPVVGLPGNPSTEDVRQTIMRWVGPLLASRASANLREWTGIPIDVDSARTFREAYVDMATALPGAASLCLAGAVSDCAVALGIDRPEHPPWAYWNPDGRRAVVERLARSYQFSDGRRRMIGECLQDGLDQSCIAYLDLTFASNVGFLLQLAPLGSAPRQTVLLVAMRMGGPGALGRLLADRSPTPRGAIEAAAGQPLESVLTVWHSAVTATNPEAQAATSGARLATLFWSLVFGAMALGGTRWRAG